MNKLVSIIIPVYNEEKNIPLVYKKIIEIWDNLKGKYDYEIIFVDDGSEDKSVDILEYMATRDQRIKYLEFSRNFGKETATTAGIQHAQGDAVILMDGDLQHPPELIPEFLAKWEKGAEIVIGVRKKNEKASIIKRIGSSMFYKISDLIAEVKTKPYSTDFRLLDRKVAREFNRFTEKNRMTRELIDWLGFKKEYIYFISPDRQYGEPRYGYLKLTKLALSSFVANSLFPLKVAGYLGIIISFIFGILGLFIIIEKYILDDPLSLKFSGLSIVVVFVSFLVGLVLSCLGLIALYIGNIHTEIANRPLYVLRGKKNIEKINIFMEGQRK